MRKMATLFFCCVFLTGCATFTTGAFQKIPIYSNPQGADVMTDSGQFGTTPCKLELERNRIHIITLKKKGYKTIQIILRKEPAIATILSQILGGVVGYGIDTESGSAFTLTPKEVQVELIPGNDNETVLFKSTDQKQQRR